MISAHAPPSTPVDARFETRPVFFSILLSFLYFSFLSIWWVFYSFLSCTFFLYDSKLPCRNVVGI